MRLDVWTKVVAVYSTSRSPSALEPDSTYMYAAVVHESMLRHPEHGIDLIGHYPLKDCII